jgi:hypothetical protein
MGAGKGLPASVPLRGLAVKAEVVGMVAQVEVTQRYVNAESAPIEAVFKFRQEECSIYGFEAIVDGEKVVGEIKEKEEALNTYATHDTTRHDTRDTHLSWFVRQIR